MKAEVTELQQPAGGAVRRIPPTRSDTATGIDGPRLHRLSVEHAAIAVKLNHRERNLVVLLGQGLNDRIIGQRLAMDRRLIATRVRALREKTGMSRLSLGVLGYNLSGQNDFEFRPAA